MSLQPVIFSGLTFITAASWVSSLPLWSIVLIEQTPIWFVAWSIFLVSALIPQLVILLIQQPLSWLAETWAYLIISYLMLP